MSDLDTTIKNERLKLRANMLNAMAAGCYAIGVVAPGTAVLFFHAAEPIAVARVATGIAVMLAVTGVLHYVANRTLGGMT